MTMKNEALEKLFANNSDCYADTWSFSEKDAEWNEGEVIQAMTKEKFVEVVSELLCGGQPVVDTEANEVLPGVIKSVCDAPKCLVKDDKYYDEWYCSGCDYNPKQTVL